MRALLPPITTGVMADQVAVGHVYANQHGGLYVIVSKREPKHKGGHAKTAFLLLDVAGEIQSAGCYDESFFLKRPLVGRAKLPDFTISWVPPSNAQE